MATNASSMTPEQKKAEAKELKSEAAGMQGVQKVLQCGAMFALAVPGFDVSALPAAVLATGAGGVAAALDGAAVTLDKSAENKAAVVKDVMGMVVGAIVPTPPGAGAALESVTKEIIGDKAGEAVEKAVSGVAKDSKTPEDKEKDK
jgi:hypothetical protein